MESVGIVEPDDEVRELIVHVVTRLGREPVPWSGGDLGHIDALVAEPGHRGALPLARALREQRPELPILFVSIYPPDHESRALTPVAHLMKPFRLEELERALAEVLSATG
jgi:hypothetical protein